MLRTEQQYPNVLGFNIGLTCLPNVNEIYWYISLNFELFKC